MARIDGRAAGELRAVRIIPNYIKHPAGSCLIEAGDTKVICTATVEEEVPPFLAGKGTGWVTAEYGMLPGSTNTRVRRDKVATSGRTMEIQRLIGRSLRGVIDTAKLGERTIKIDCDVIQADGGTRTAAITGGFVALGLAVKTLLKKGALSANPLTDYVAAISVGYFNGQLLLDLNYHEDAKAQTDMNVVMLGSGRFIEVQGTAENGAFAKEDLDRLVALAEKGIRKLISLQKKELGFKL